MTVCSPLMSVDPKEWKLRALTLIWTGDARRQGNRVIPTGLMGSIRWWFEVLVRGLGGSACDPTEPDSRCSDRNSRGRHCVVCELYGCTGWARKFRMQVLDENGDVLSGAIQENQTFALRFIPLRPICGEEWALLDLSLRLIAGYGAIGGKTVLKPSDEPDRRGAPYHRDYGLIEVVKTPGDLPVYTKNQLELYVKSSHWCRVNHGGFAWASLEHFWCIKGRYLARQNRNASTFNRVIGRRENKDKAQQLAGNAEANQWLAGEQQKSKKVFSFKNPEKARRTFGFVSPGRLSFDDMKRRLSLAWPDFQDDEFMTGGRILQHFLSQ